jgi:flagellar L-ring protein FlgH
VNRSSETTGGMARGLALVAAAAAVSCTAALPFEHPLEANPLPVPAHDPHEEPRTEGSLWSGDTSRRFLAFENRAKQVGDLVTVVIREKAEAENTATTDLERTTELEATLGSDIQLQTLVTRPVRNLLRFLGFTNDRADRDPSGELSIVDAETTSSVSGEGTVERGSEFTTTLACVVTEVSDSGLLRVEGQRLLTINYETQVIRLSGYVRPEDIQIDNSVSSTLVAQAVIEFGGQGVVSERQRAPWLGRLFDLILPF